MTATAFVWSGVFFYDGVKGNPKQKENMLLQIGGTPNMMASVLDTPEVTGSRPNSGTLPGGSQPTYPTGVDGDVFLH